MIEKLSEKYYNRLLLENNPKSLLIDRDYFGGCAHIGTREAVPSS